MNISAKIMDGKKVANEIKVKIKAEIDNLVKTNQRIPKLVIIQVGDNHASNTYIRNKRKACETVGIQFELLKFDETITQAQLEVEMNNLNNDHNVDGFIVQLPLPKHIDSSYITNIVNVNKDVDGFNPYIMGQLVLNNPTIIPGTPKGIMTLLKYYNVDLVGKNVVVIGRSNIVGKPIANLLINAHATVTVCNTKTANLKEKTHQADILIVAAGKAKIVTKEMVKENAIVIDVGINRDEDNKLCGDVDFNDVLDKVSLITPVPGGVGPMTIASLLENTMTLYYLHQKSGF